MVDKSVKRDAAAEAAELAAFRAWRAKYEPVEQEVLARRERLFAARKRSRAERRKWFAGLCEATEGLAAVRREELLRVRDGAVPSGWTRRGGRTPLDELVWGLSRGRFRSAGGLGPLGLALGVGEAARQLAGLAAEDSLLALLGDVVARRGDPLTEVCLVNWLGRSASRRLEGLRRAVRRPSYYAAENARRRRLAALRRKVARRSTESPAPTREQILDAWLARRGSHEAAIRFGSLVCDLECYVDNSLRRDGFGNIVGRNGGVKRWLQENIPALYKCYTTVMRYKAAAEKLRQIAGIADPVPAARLVEDTPGGAERDYGADEIQAPGAAGEKGGGRADERGGGRTGWRPGAAADGETAAGEMVGEMGNWRTGWRSGVAVGAAAGERELALLRGRAIWLEVKAGAGRSATALMDRIDALLDPGRVEDANMLGEWRRKYEREITVRTKSRWRGRLWGRGGRRGRGDRRERKGLRR